MSALVLLQQLEGTDTICNTFNSIVALYQQQEALEIALEQFDRALTNHEGQEYHFEPDVADGLELLGFCHAQAAEFGKSLTCYSYAKRFREVLLKN